MHSIFQFIVDHATTLAGWGAFIASEALALSKNVKCNSILQVVRNVLLKLSK